MPDLHDTKQLLRAEMRAKREKLAFANTHAAYDLAKTFLRLVTIPENAVIASYVAFRDEMDPSPLAERLRERGHKIALPVMLEKGTPLLFRLAEKNVPLLPNRLNIPEPPLQAPEIEPDVLLVPLLAFDHKRNRLGYGGGYYDRTIAKLRLKKTILAVGLAYAFQEVAKIPLGNDDVALDTIVTEQSVF